MLEHLRARLFPADPRAAGLDANTEGEKELGRGKYLFTAARRLPDNGGDIRVREIVALE